MEDKDMKNIVTTKSLSKLYGRRDNIVTALNNVDLQVNEGEFLGVMGPSGAGKSTLLNILATIDELSSGEVLINGKNIADMPESELCEFRRNNLGFIFQDYNLLDTLTVRENILLPLAVVKMEIKRIDTEVIGVARKLSIDNILDKYPNEISGGQKQRVATARALITKPSLILADEPTGALDSKSSTDLLEIMKELTNSNNVTIMMVTHDSFAASFCSRVVFIKDGAIFTELVKGNSVRKDFFKKILDVLSAMGGATIDVI
jgi:putative ABC transport system ATP-binding protein